MKTHPLRTINNVLSVAVLVLALYIILLPFLPQMAFWAGHSAGHVDAAPAAQGPSIAKEIPKENMLLIPSLGMRELIFSGDSAAELKKGAWHRPHTSTPDQGSNTVIVGHRFTYTQPKGVFYDLDKVKLDDSITIYWQGKEYTYKVQAIRIVPPTAVEIEAPTEKPILTLYTCTPLWSAKDRLVIIAGLVE